ncbi:MAG: hypothetical protein NTY08_15230 [Proteobacteria bacterium]|nr:hypothetical protein [Pseudomonadota bacterium]
MLQSRNFRASRLSRWTLPVLATVTLHLSWNCSKKSESSNFKVKPAVSSAPEPATPPGSAPVNYDPTLAPNQLRQYTSIIGRTVGGAGTINSTTPVPNVKLFGFVDGKRLESISNEDGFFIFKDIPVLGGAGGLSADKNFCIYVNGTGWDLATNTVDDTADNLCVGVHASADSPSAYQIDVGEIRFVEAPLKVTSSLHHPSRTISSKWLRSGDVTDSGWDPEVYLADPSASITLNFNRPVDTVYSDNRATNPLIDFYDPRGQPVAYSGSWDITRTIFTIKPNQNLIADNDDNTNYRIVIARPVRAMSNDTRAIFELKGVSIVFNVLANTADNLLSSQAPALDPQVDGKLNYVFDASQIFRQSIRTGSTVVDYEAPSNSFYVKWSRVAGSKSYNLYWRNLSEQLDGRWTAVNNTPISTSGSNYRPDGTYSYQITNLYSLMAGSDNVLSAGEQVQFVVTAIDSDGNESSINSVSQPLTVSDTFQPFVSLAVNSANTTNVVRAEAMSPILTRSLTVNFSENMDSSNPAQIPAITSLSGIAAISAPAISSRWSSRTSWNSKVQLQYVQPETTTTSFCQVATSLARVDSTVATFRFMVGDTVLIHDPANPLGFESNTISAIDQNTSTIKFSNNFSQDYQIGATIRLLKRTAMSGLTSIDAQSTASVNIGSTTIPVTAGRGTRFYKGQTIKFYGTDDSGIIYLGSAFIDILSANSLAVTEPLRFYIPSGAIIVDSTVVNGEIEPRAPVSFAISNNILFAPNDITSTNFFGNFLVAGLDAEPTVIQVNSVAGILVSDIVQIDATNNTVVSDNLSSDQTIGTSMTFAQTPKFFVGEELLVDGELKSGSLQVASALATGTTTLTFTQNLPVFSGELLTVSDPAFATALTNASGTGANAVTVGSVDGLNPGQTVNIEDGLHTESATIAGLTASSITISGTFANAFGVGARVVRAAINTGMTVNGSSTGAVVTTSSSQPLSKLATATVSRPSVRTTVTAISGNGVTVSPVVSPLRRSTTKVSLFNVPESATISAIDSQRNTLTFSSNLSYNHRAGTTVTKSAQKWLNVVSNQASVKANTAIGDTIIVDSLAADATRPLHADRFALTVVGVDTANNRIKVSSNRTGMTILPSQNLTLLGDAVAIGAAQDSNGNAITSGSQFRVNLNDGTVK